MINILRVLILVIFIFSSNLSLGLQSYSGSIVVEWIDSDDHRRMKLLEEIKYTDSNGVEWIVPKGAVIDGASIPRVFWSLIGPPFVGAYRKASVIHDHYCDTKVRPWKQVHRMFLDASLASGVSPAKAHAMYAAVYSGGPRWKEVKLIGSSPEDKPIVIPVTPPLSEDQKANAVNWSQQDSVTPEQIEMYIDELEAK